MMKPTGRMMDAFWRAAVYCLHPRVIVMSLLPLVIVAGLAVALSYFFWEPAVDGVRAALSSMKLIESLLSWLDAMGASAFRAALAPIIVLAIAVPAIVVLSLLLVALLMTPAMVDLVAKRRFDKLERKKGAPFWQGALWSLWHSVLAVLALVISMPFWLIPPLVLILPPLIWGWLGYRVFSFDALAEHASVIERRRILKEHRLPLLLLGVVTGYLGAAPAAIWAVSIVSVALAPVLIVVSIWLYTLVFAFSTLWFTHYVLGALDELRREREPVAKPFDLPGEPPAIPAAPTLIPPTP